MLNLKPGDRVRWSERWFETSWKPARQRAKWERRRGTVLESNRITIGCVRVMWDGNRNAQTVAKDYLEPCQ